MLVKIFLHQIYFISHLIQFTNHFLKTAKNNYSIYVRYPSLNLHVLLCQKPKHLLYLFFIIDARIPRYYYLLPEYL